MRRKLGLTTTLLVLVALSAQFAHAARSDSNEEAVFSISIDQFADSSQGSVLLVRDRVYHSDQAILPFASQFVETDSSIDALAVVDRTKILFSVAIRGLAFHSGPPMVLEPDRAYLYDPATDRIEHRSDWSSWGIDIGGLDAIDLLPDGSLAFSNEEFTFATHSAGTINLLPQNVYRFFPTTGRIELLLDGQRLGLGNIDGIDVLATGRVAFSTASTFLVLLPDRVRLLRPEDAYLVELDGDMTRVFDGSARDVTTLNAFDLELSLLAMEDDLIYWSELTTSSGMHDLVRGELTALRVAGDFSLATSECLAGAMAGTIFHWGDAPQPGSPYWFLTRESGGSHDSSGPSQVAGRDAGIAASGAACP